MEVAEGAPAKQIGEKLIGREKLADGVFARGESRRFEPVRRVWEWELEGMSSPTPFAASRGANGEWDYDVPMLPGDHVTDDAGTGFVHTAPSHGDDDYQLGLKHGLPMTYNVMER